MEQVRPGSVAMSSLDALCRIPSTPYYEKAGADWVLAFSRGLGLETAVDRYGNVLARRPGTGPGAPGIAFVAHLDHPGFEALAVDGDHVVAEMRGGLSEAAMAPGQRVGLVGTDGKRVAGEVLGRIATESEQSIAGDPDSREVKRIGIRVERDSMPSLPCGVVLDLPDIALDGEMIRARALDDLAGCAGITAALAAASVHPTPGAVYGLFTRAEEVGLEGARLAAEDGLIPRDTLVVSVESSRTLPGAELGGGPVIRVGDRISTFDRDAESVLQEAAARITRNDRSFRVQRQLMSGGVCEGSAFAAFGYRVTGVAFPLGNYHNAAPGNTIDAEYISAVDFASGARLLAEAATLAGTPLQAAPVRRFGRRPAAGERRLLGG